MKTNPLYSITKHALSLIAFFAVFLLFTGCKIDNPDNPNGQDTASGGTLQVTVSMPGDTPDTRISLEEAVDGSGNVSLAWEKGDVINFVFTQGVDNKGKHTVTLAEKDILEDGKKASFALTIPDGINDGPFNLYGVYGGGGFVEEEDSYEITLPQTPWSGTLSDVQNNKVMLLRFEATIDRDNPESVPITFAHVGSLFHIRLNNTGTTDLNGITKAELVAGSTIQAYQNNGSATYDPVTDAFSETPTSSSLPFDIDSEDLAAEGTLDFWGWYPPVASENWPALGLKITASEGTYTSINTQSARTLPTLAGKAYHFYANCDGTNLYFTDMSGPEGIFVDYSCDPSDPAGIVYKTIKIGDQIWMAENLRCLPSGCTLSGEGVASISKDPLYYVYGYNGGTIDGAKITTNYQTYGVIYNWLAAMQGAESSTTNPSNVKGICPDGWHLPSDAEWTQMEEYLANNGYNYDYDEVEPPSNPVTGDNARKKIAKALASKSSWNSSSTKGAPGNTDYPEYRNKSGFTALAGGGFTGASNSFTAINIRGLWWSSTQKDSNQAYYRYLEHNSSDVKRSDTSKNYGRSVRCIKD